MKNITHYFLLFTILISGCRPDEITGPSSPYEHTLYIPQEAKDYCYFQPGTYWVYQDSATGELDSVYVYEAGAGIDTVTATQSNPTEGIFEWLYCNKKSARDGYAYNSWIDMSWSSQPQIDASTKMYTIKTRPGDPVGQTIQIGFPLNSNHRTYYTSWGSTQNTTNIDRLMGYSVNFGDTFNLVIRSNHDYCCLLPYRANFYYAPHVGLFRAEQPDSARVWKLLRANIVQ
jgi:hypothetical protein